MRGRVGARRPCARLLGPAGPPPQHSRRRPGSRQRHAEPVRVRGRGHVPVLQSVASAWSVRDRGRNAGRPSLDGARLAQVQARAHLEGED
eukprot:270339-Pyramimonas_sp.AAC.1